MIRLLKTVLFVSFVSFFILACGKEEYNDSGATVRFKINLNTQDSKLNGLHNYAVFTAPRLANERVGRAGLLVFYENLDMDRNIPILVAYDRLCPNDNMPDATVVPNSNLKAVCSKCKLEYDLLAGGAAVSSSSKKRLYYYRVRAELPYSGVFNISNY